MDLFSFKIGPFLFVDEKWTYFETKFYYRKKLSSSVFARTGTVLNGKLLRTKDFENIVNKDFKKIAKSPELVECWDQIDSNFLGFDLIVFIFTFILFIKSSSSFEQI